jgi:hypothetical protein
MRGALRVPGGAYRDLALCLCQDFFSCRPYHHPKKKLRDIQKEENKKKGNAFDEEITALRPDVAIFSTSRAYDEHIENLLPRTSMKDVGPEHLKIKEIEGLGCPAFRTYHS